MNRASLRVLLVEDSPTDAQLFQRIFLRAETKNWEIVHVETLSGAISACQTQSFDLVLLDLQLPDSEERDTVSQFNQAVPEIPIIILTMFDDEEFAIQAMSQGAQDYLVKDQVTTQMLRRSIRYALERSQILQQLQASARLSLEALNKERELNQLKSYFVSMVSHEFRNPLASLRMMSESLLRFGHKLTPDKKDSYARRIDSTINNMCQLLDEVIILGRVDTYNVAEEARFLNLEELCNELIESLRLGDNHQHPIILNFHLDSKVLKLDASLLEHILSNLISNALKYSPTKSEVIVEVGEQAGLLSFSVSDRGIGIPEGEQVRLFQTFSRCSNVGSIQGTGLGLAIVKRCVDLYQGEIKVESQVGVGTKITVLLPINLADNDV